MYLCIMFILKHKKNTWYRNISINLKSQEKMYFKYNSL